MTRRTGNNYSGPRRLFAARPQQTAVCSECGKTEVSDHGDDQRFLCRDCVAGQTGATK